MPQKRHKTTELGWDFDADNVRRPALRDADTNRPIYVGFDGTRNALLVSRTPSPRCRPRSATRAKAGQPKAPPKPEKGGAR